MTSRLLLSLAVMLAFSSTAVAGGLSADERAALAAQPNTHIASLRAGASEAVPPVSVAERVELARAMAATTDLDTLRAGEHNDHTFEVLRLVLGIVALAILIF